MEYEPYNEQLALRLMTLYERGGDRSRAIRFFNEFRNRLASNLEIYPGSAITQKYAELKAAPAAPEPAQAADSVPGLHVQTYCLRAVPCFWMADTVGKLLDAVGNDVRPDDRALLRVLGVSFAYQPALWLAALAWGLAFAQFLYCYGPMLCRTRADGHPG